MERFIPCFPRVFIFVQDLVYGLFKALLTKAPCASSGSMLLPRASQSPLWSKNLEKLTLAILGLIAVIDTNVAPNILNDSLDVLFFWQRKRPMGGV